MQGMDENFKQIPLDTLVDESGSDDVPFLHCLWEGCRRRFCLIVDLTKHIEADHVEANGPNGSFICLWQDCLRGGASMKPKYKMLNHVRIHTQTKPFLCTKCGKRFGLKEKLIIHTRTHTGERPYKCSFEGCEKAYANTGDLTKHLHTHRTEKPFACKYLGCGKQYTDPSSLRKHMKLQGHQIPLMSREEVVDYSAQIIGSNSLLSSASVHFSPMDSVMESPGSIETCGEVTLSSSSAWTESDALLYAEYNNAAHL